MTVKLIKHTGECSHERDQSLPFTLEMVLRVPSFMSVAFVAMYGGSEEVVAQADSEQELRDWMRDKGLEDHPRLSRYTITGSHGVVEDYNSWREPKLTSRTSNP